MTTEEKKLKAAYERMWRVSQYLSDERGKAEVSLYAHNPIPGSVAPKMSKRAWKQMETDKPIRNPFERKQAVDAAWFIVVECRDAVFAQMKETL